MFFIFTRRVIFQGFPGYQRELPNDTQQMDVSVKAKNRTLEVFEFFARERRAASLTEIARGIRMPMSSCFNLIKSLQAIGFLYSVDGKRQFYPTRKLFDM